jgi:hypothetical protein
VCNAVSPSFEGSRSDKKAKEVIKENAILGMKEATKMRSQINYPRPAAENSP